jgi:hypothetical protein
MDMTALACDCGKTELRAAVEDGRSVNAGAALTAGAVV